MSASHRVPAQEFDVYLWYVMKSRAFIPLWQDTMSRRTRKEVEAVLLEFYLKLETFVE